MEAPAHLAHTPGRRTPRRHGVLTRPDLAL